MWLVSRPAAAFAVPTVREGILLPIGYTALVLVAATLVLSINMPIRRLVDSLRRVMVVGQMQQMVDVPARTTDQELAISFRSDELRSFKITSQQDIVIATQPGALAEDDVIEVAGGEPYAWQQATGRAAPFQDWVSTLYVTNSSDAPSRVEFELLTGVEYPEVLGIPATAACLVGLYLIYILIAAALPKMSAIAVATAKEATSQPIFYLTLGLGAFALIVFIYVPYNTFGEDVKVLKDSGLTLIMVLSIIVALWTASVSVADEIEGRTALTLLSKPIGRRQFILGKFLGIIWPVILMFVLLGLLFLVTVSYKVVYDARETAATDPSLAGMLRRDDQHRAGTGARVDGNGGPDIDQRCDLDAAADAAQPDHLRVDLCPRPPRSDDRQFGRGQVRDCRIRRSADRDRLAGTRLLQHASGDCLWGQSPAELPGVGAGLSALYSTIAMLLALALFEDRDLA